MLESLEDFDLEQSQGNESTGYPHFFSLDYQHVQVPFEITLWIMLASLAKIGMLQSLLLWTGKVAHKAGKVTPSDGAISREIMPFVDNKSSPAALISLFLCHCVYGGCQLYCRF